MTVKRSWARRWEWACGSWGLILTTGFALGFLNPLAVWAIEGRVWAVAAIPADMLFVALVVVGLVRHRRRLAREAEQARTEGRLRVVMSPSTAQALGAGPAEVRDTWRELIETAERREGLR